MAQRGTLIFDGWIYLDNTGLSGNAVWISPPELDVPIGNAKNIAFTAELTGVGQACSSATGPELAVLGVRRRQTSTPHSTCSAT